MSNAKKSLFAGVLLIVNSLANKLVGLISTLILARILAPEDFGLVAITTLVLGFVNVFATTGSQSYIFQKDVITDDVLNTAWTLDLILKTVVALGMFISAPFVAEYYGNQSLTYALQIVALHPILQGLTNPGIWLLQKEQNFGSYVKQSIAIKILTVIVTITAAVTLQNYWALIIGATFAQVLGAGGGYLLHPHRPKFSLSCLKQQFAFSGWLTPTAILGYLRTQLDTFIVSATFGQSQLGSYHVMKYLAFIPTQEIINPGTQPLLAELAKVKHDKESFCSHFRLSIACVMLIALPMSCFLYVFSDLCVELLLGEQWISYDKIFGVFAGLILSAALLNQVNRVLTVYEKTKFIFYIEIASFSIIYGSLWMLGFVDVLSFSSNRVLLEMGFCLALFLGIAVYFIGVPQTIKMALVQGAIILIAVVSAYVVNMLRPYIADQLLLIKMIILGTSYVVCYALLLVVLYKLVFNKTYEGNYINNLVAGYLGKFLKKATV